MKKTLLAAASLLLLGVAACKKEYYTTNTSIPGTQNVNVNTGTPNYLVDGIQDLTLQKVDSGLPKNTAFMPLNITYNNRSQERLRLSLEGKPSGVTDSITVKTGYPSFSSAVLLTDSTVAVGTYPMKLVVTGDSSGRREFSFDLKVLPVRSCALDLVDTPYTASSACAGSSSYPVGIRQVGSGNQIRLNNFDNAGGSLLVNIDCSTQTLTVPAQTVNGVSYLGGSGSYFIFSGGKQLSLTAQINSGTGTPISCTISMFK